MNWLGGHTLGQMGVRILDKERILIEGGFEIGEELYKLVSSKKSLTTRANDNRKMLVLKPEYIGLKQSIISPIRQIYLYYQAKNNHYRYRDMRRL